ncbi:MAG: ABC transporter substrate-binding protein, partial [Cyanobacteria bacterium P01_A01_bin.17]
PKHFRLYAEALGRSEQAEQLLQSYQEQVETFRQQLDQPAAMEISLLSSYENKIGAYTTGSFPGSVLQDIGFARNSTQDITRRYALRLSQEALTKLDGDFIFLIYSSHFPGVIKKEEFITDPIWSQLRAVQQNRVCEVPNEVWIAGRSILAAQQILRDVGKCLNLEELD